VCVHSGYNWRWLSAQNHDHHHSTNKCAFGAIGLLDWVHGTRYIDIVERQQKQL
jgi:sterol desaturase/sphingolipid hydroxylase (fatty acid hydroxylase superfamily)